MKPLFVHTVYCLEQKTHFSHKDVFVSFHSYRGTGNVLLHSFKRVGLSSANLFEAMNKSFMEMTQSFVETADLRLFAIFSVLGDIILDIPDKLD